MQIMPGRVTRSNSSGAVRHPSAREVAQETESKAAEGSPLADGLQSPSCTEPLGQKRQWDSEDDGALRKKQKLEASSCGDKSPKTTWVQCDACQKWRSLQQVRHAVKQHLPSGAIMSCAATCDLCFKSIVYSYTAAICIAWHQASHHTSCQGHKLLCARAGAHLNVYDVPGRRREVCKVPQESWPVGKQSTERHGYAQLYHVLTKCHVRRSLASRPGCVLCTQTPPSGLASCLKSKSLWTTSTQNAMAMLTALRRWGTLKT